jgi:hypothetical protein
MGVTTTLLDNFKASSLQKESDVTRQISTQLIEHLCD